MQDLNLFAANAGINLNGFVLADAVSISDNGQIIAGKAYDNVDIVRGYVLQLAQVTQARLIVTIRLPGVTQTSIVNQSFSTQVDGLLNGKSVFTRTVTDAITGAGGVSALADARTALSVGSGLRRVVIGAPVLISNTTTVTDTTSNTVDVATGNLGTCATVAADRVNPTGCSLPGTAVNVDAGVLNSNVFTNTINSVPPTTTQTVNQLINAKWQVSATAGNRFGTAHALVGPAAFESGNRLMAELLARGGAGGVGTGGVTRANAPARNASALGGEGSGLSMFGGYFGNWSGIDADTALAVASVSGKTNGLVLGLEKQAGDATKIGVAVDHGTSRYDVRDATYSEALRFKQTQIALYGGWRGGALSLSGAAAYGFGKVDTTLQSPGGPATASRHANSWSLGAQAGYAVQLGKMAQIELQGGVRHTTVRLGSFTETGGTSPLIGLETTVSRTRLFAGAELSGKIAMGGNATLTPRAYARVISGSGDICGVADVVFASAPNAPALQAIGPGVGKTGAELGASLEARVSNTVSIWAGYDGSFRSSAASHAAKAGATMAF